MARQDIVQTLLDLGEDGFLTGDASGERAIDVDDIFAKDFEDAAGDLTRYEPGWDAVRWSEVAVTPSDQAGFLFVEFDGGLLLVDEQERKIVGGFLGADLVLAWDYRGRGLGREIVQEYFVRSENLPTWWLDDAAYSTDGERTCRAAYRSMVGNPEATRARVARLDAALSGERTVDLGALGVFGVSSEPSVR